MPIADMLDITPSAVLWGIVWFIVLTIVLYFTRVPAHRAILSFAQIFRKGFRVSSSSMMQAHRKLEARNREVLLAAGREATERIIEREFERVDSVVASDLAGCPALDRRMNEEVTKIEEDHQESVVVPPAPPAWTEVVQAVAKIPPSGDPMVGKIMQQIHGSLVKAQDQATEEYRKATKARHKYLHSMMPHWRKLSRIANEMNKNFKSLLDRTKVIDRHMDDYEQVVRKSDRAVQMLSSSSMSQFFISGLVLCIAIGGAAINFHLIARPMSEMVGGNSSIAGFKTSDVAALVIILVEISMGLFLMESLRITRLFPVISALPDKMRVRMIWITFGLLFSLACVEAGLAYMREVLMQDELATSAVLRGGGADVVANDFVWITTVAQMGMGFILPFALVFIAIPLETFIHSLRTVLGMFGVIVLRAMAVIMRVLADIFGYSGKLLVNVYDLLIFGPLWLEGHFKPQIGIGKRKVAKQLANKQPVLGPPAATPVEEAL